MMERVLIYLVNWITTFLGMALLFAAALEAPAVVVQAVGAICVMGLGIYGFVRDGSRK